jgi:tetratricopeptide (TPR) repeat protein
MLPMLLFLAVETCSGSLAPATLALQQKDPAKALALLDPLRGQCAQSSAFFELLGLASELSGKGPAAEEALRFAVSLDPKSPRLLTELGATYLRNGSPGEAAKVLDEALALDPSNTDTMKYAVGAAVQSGAWQRAGALFHQLGAEDHPEALQGEPILVLWFAQTLIETNRSDRIKTLLSPQRKLTSPGLLFSLGTLFAQHRMYERAVECFRQVPAQAADEALYFNLGLSYSHLKKFDQARECYFQAIDKHSEHADAYLHVGLDYVVSGDPRMGIPWLWRAHKLAPDRPDISYALVEDTADYCIEMAVRFFPPYRGGRLVFYNSANPRKELCYGANGDSQSCVQRFVGAVAAVTYRFQPRRKNLPEAATSREIVKVLSQSEGLDERPPYTREQPLVGGVGSDVQAFGYDESAVAKPERAALRAQSRARMWRVYRQELFLGGDSERFGVVEWKHTLDRIKVLRATGRPVAHSP